MLALALRRRSLYLTPVKCLKGLPNKREADSMDGEMLQKLSMGHE